MQDLVFIGKTKKATGINGQLKVFVEDKYLEDFLQAKVIFLTIQGKNVPFFVEQIAVTNAPLLKFEDINSRQDALALTSKEMFLRPIDIIPEQDRQFIYDDGLEFSKYQGFQVFDANTGLLGTLKEVQEYPQQEMGIIAMQDREILIPLHMDLVDTIDANAKQLVLDLPEGLTDL